MLNLTRKYRDVSDVIEVLTWIYNRGIENYEWNVFRSTKLPDAIISEFRQGSKFSMRLKKESIIRIWRKKETYNERV